MGRLEGKAALVTGASRGIGRAIALELAQEGAKVAVNYQNNDAKAQEVADAITKFGGTCLLAKADLANPQEARAISSGLAKRPSGMRVLICIWMSSGTLASISVSVKPGAMAFTVMPALASSSAAVRVKAMMPPLLAL